MYYLKTEADFDSAHFLKDYDGKCKNIHGHSWRVVCELKSERLIVEGKSRGMIMDFSDIKKILKAMCDELDHSLIYEKDSLREETTMALKGEGFRLCELPFRPTAENFSEYFFYGLREKGIPVSRIEVYETEKNCAVYEEQE